MDEIKIVERLEADWSVIRKNVVDSYVSSTGKKRVWFAHEYKSFKLTVFATLGARGGLSEEILLIDSSQPTVADRLHLSNDDNFSGILLKLKEVRHEMRHGNDHLEVVTECMKQLLAEIQAHPEHFYRDAVIPRQGLVSASVETVSGGAYGMKR